MEQSEPDATRYVSLVETSSNINELLLFSYLKQRKFRKPGLFPSKFPCCQ